MTTYAYQELVYSVDDPVATIAFNRPDALNAFTPRTLAELRHALAAAEADARVVGIVVTGSGRGFSAGMDMNALADMSKGGSGGSGAEVPRATPGDDAMGENFQGAFTYLLAVRKPVIAAINGACAGLGLCIAMLCDMRFAERQAKFTTAFAQRGLIAEHAISWILPRLIGSSRALDLLWSARRFDGEEAVRLGVADRLCETGTSVEAAAAYIREIAATASPTSLKVMKQQVYRHLNMELGAAMDETNRWMDESLKRADFREGVESFMQRRPPRFPRIEG
jgi:enoyl-CoA hydratase/carnithine racemase